MQTRTFTDQMGRLISIPFPPKRIISLVPSQTELLYDLGLEDRIRGLTQFCIHPAEKVSSAIKIGGTKKLNLVKIRELSPDLIIGNKEENDQSQIETLMQEFPVWMSDISCLQDSIEMIRACGIITDRESQAKQLAEKIEFDFSSLKPAPDLSCAYFIWKGPYMVAGKNTFIDDLLDKAGFKNVFSESRYPEISLNDLEALVPDLIFLSSEPFPFKEHHLNELAERFPRSQLKIVDGEMFSWYGSRLLHSVRYLRELINTLTVKAKINSK